MSTAFWWGVAGLTVVALTLSSDTSIPARWGLLYQLHPAARKRFLNLLLRIEARTGWTVVLTSAWRPSDTSLGYHYFGLGLDINATNGNQALRMASTKAEWEASGIPDIIRAAGFRWGGDFTSPRNGGLPGYDPVHVDEGRRISLTNLRLLAKAQAPAGDTTRFDGRVLPV
ncbi:M15 family metallopeptidase [Hymenobacter metallilatus]|uniref:M15 family peptidase n=1 Tax=Hymenobacter metallilatus TaxID=2493666 RepID=A0A428IYW4_9BACT|nr:M15 family metallopeptidase [Hymenobacter metallilatus]RSK24186.1 M15 family peptidase [Hymenobacter metallilatus]